MKTVQLKVGEFDVAVAFYAENVLVIVHSAIPGVGNIIYTERDGGELECDQLIGTENEMLTLFATSLAQMFGTPNATFVFAFPPAKIQSFEDIRAFVDALGEAVKPK